MSRHTYANGINVGCDAGRIVLVRIADNREIAETLPESSIWPWCSADRIGCSTERLARLLRLGIGQIEITADWR